MQTISQRDRELFENLFVLELANNHWGDISRGKKIVQDYGKVIRHNGIKAAIKLQFRDVENFIHPDFSGNTEIRYIHKTEATRMDQSHLQALVHEIVQVGAIPMATPFDEASVDLCVELNLPIIKIASSDINDWPLIERIGQTRRPVIVSTGGASEKSIDDIVHFFTSREIPMALNHCVSLYPSEDHEIELNQIDYLRGRYPSLVIGFSSHEQYDWTASMLMSYAKGARTWERHIDIDHEGVPVSPYCSLPHQVDTWFKAFKKAQEMCGGSTTARRAIPRAETKYLDALVRGIYARKPLSAGYVFNKTSFAEDFFLAIPLRRGQLSVREIVNGEVLTRDLEANEPLTVDHIDGPYAEDANLRQLILDRGL